MLLRFFVIIFWYFFFGEFSEETFTKVFKKEIERNKFFEKTTFNGVLNQKNIRNNRDIIILLGFLLICHQFNLWMEFHVTFRENVKEKRGKFKEEEEDDEE